VINREKEQNIQHIQAVGSDKDANKNIGGRRKKERSGSNSGVGKAKIRTNIRKSK
jgi:hypothetical protein